ncbi:histidine kinase [soil metagenome]
MLSADSLRRPVLYSGIVVTTGVTSLWSEPRVSDPPVRVWRDWALVAALVPAAVIEAVLRDDLVWRPLSLLFTVGVAFALLWRRTQPFLTVAVVFGSVIVGHVAAIILGLTWEGLGTATFPVLLLPYALFRWGAGREAAIGLPLMLIPVLLIAFNDPFNIGDMVGGGLFLMFPAAVGTSVRYLTNSRSREMEQIKLLEREQLARELHDAVAHHVSAIAVRAQAGRTLAASRPEAAVENLAVIEEEASRALTEMRSMVGALRGADEPNLAPQPGVANIVQLARTTGNRPHVDVKLSGDLEGLRSSVDAALYRLAQESITNAVRHARHATRIAVQVAGGRDHVHLTVNDDGNARPSGAGTTPGFGLVGMSERAKLLGGTLTAGPNADKGWTVEATLPRHGAAP